MATQSIGSLTVSIGADTTGIDRSLKKNTRNLEKWSAASKAAIGIAVGLATRKIIEYSDAFTSLNNKLKIATNGTEELTKVTNALFDIANDTRSSVSATAELYAKMERATRGLDVSQERLLRITESVNKAFAISGATTQEAQGSIRQLGQALASGALRGDEFNSIAEQAPIIMEAVSKATGKTAGELRKLAAEGMITAEILIESLERYEDEIDGDFATSTATYGQKLEIAGNNAIKFVGENDKLNQSIASLGDTVVFLSTNLDNLITVAKTVSVTYGGVFVSSLINARVEKNRLAKASEMLAVSEAKAAKVASALSAKRTSDRLKEAKQVASLAVTEARADLVSIQSSKAKATQAVIEARVIDEKIKSSVLAAQAQVKLAAVEAQRVGNNAVLVAAETKLTAAKVASTASSKSLVAAEAAVSKTTKNLTGAKVNAKLAAKNLTTAKNASSIASQRLKAANDALTVSAKKATFATRTLTGATNLAKGALAFLGGPIGVLITVAASLALFVDWETKAEKQTKKTSDAYAAQTDTLKGLDKAQRAIAKGKLLDEQRKLEFQINITNRKLDNLRGKLDNAFKSGVDGKSPASTPGFINEIGIQTNKATIELTDLSNKLKLVNSGLLDIKVADVFEGVENPEEDFIKLEKVLTESQKLAAKNKAKREADRIKEEKERRQKEADDILLDFEKRFASEKALEDIFNQEDKDRLAIAFAEKKTSKEEQDRIMEQLETDHQQRLKDIEFAQNEAKRQIFERNASSILNSLKTLGAKSVKVQKAVALAQAGISIATGIARAQELGFPANIAEMARVAAVGISAIRGIKSANVGSSGSMGGGGAGASGATSPGATASTSPGGAQQPATANRTLTLNLLGNPALTSLVRDAIIPIINEAFDDNITIKSEVGG